MSRLHGALFVFGVLFAVAGLNQYDVIHEMLLLKNLDPFLIMGSAMATGLPLLWFLERRKWRTPLGGPLHPTRRMFERTHLYVGVVFGIGWAITGACPSTLSTTLGAGSLLGLPLVVGVIAGISLRDMVAAKGLVPALCKRALTPSD